jgi:hypothetical protein
VTTTIERGRLTGGQQRTRCTLCEWSLPAVATHGRHLTDAEKDTQIEVAGEHIDHTGHPVRLTVVTLWDRDVEETDITLHPRVQRSGAT